MSEPTSDAPSQRPPEPPTERYGQARSALTSRAVALLLTLLVGALLVAGVVTMVRLNDSPDISGEVMSVSIVDDERADVVMTVTRDEPSTPAYCILRAKDETKGEVGRREVYVPPSEDERVRVEASIPTWAPAFEADVYGCGSDVPDYLRR